jgi:hypothetical protein
MTDDALFRSVFIAVQVNGDFSEATLSLSDGSRMEFVHHVGQRTVKAIGPAGQDFLASQVLARIARFRLNGKHLEIFFADRSRWELLFDQRPKGTEPSR